METQIKKYVSSGLMGSTAGEECEHNQETSRLLNLIEVCEDVEVFKHENRMYLGNKINAVKNYIHNNPEPADFGVWLQQNYKEI